MLFSYWVRPKPWFVTAIKYFKFYRILVFGKPVQFFRTNKYFCSFSRFCQLVLELGLWLRWIFMYSFARAICVIDLWLSTRESVCEREWEWESEREWERESVQKHSVLNLTIQHLWKCQPTNHNQLSCLFSTSTAPTSTRPNIYGRTETTCSVWSRGATILVFGARA